MATRIDRTAAAAQAAQQKLAKLQAQQAQLAAELKKQRRLETERIKALRDAERIELGRMVQEAGLDKDQLAELLASATPQPADAETQTRGQDVDESPLPGAEDIPAAPVSPVSLGTPGDTPRNWN